MNWKRMIYQGADYGDFYLVSDTGYIKNAKTGRVLKLNIVGKGYYGCIVSLGGRSHKKAIRIHKAVAETFIPNPDSKPEVNHKDGDKSHNYVDNLEWVTTKENMDHAVKHDLHHPTYGADHGTTKLTNEQVEWLRSVYQPRNKEYGARALARKLGVDHTTILSLLKGKTWKEN